MKKPFGRARCLGALLRTPELGGLFGRKEESCTRRFFGKVAIDAIGGEKKWPGCMCVNQNRFAFLVLLSFLLAFLLAFSAILKRTPASTHVHLVVIQPLNRLAPLFGKYPSKKDT